MTDTISGPARLLQASVFAAVIRPFVRLVLGLGVVNRRGLPEAGPAILVANHNSHLDTLVLMSLVSRAALPRVRPIAAADHFGGDGALGTLARGLFRAILVQRSGCGCEDALGPVLAALDRGEIVIFFPEGTRGEPERLARFKRGIARLHARRPEVPIVPVHLAGLGKCLPKDAGLFVPFACEAVVGDPLDLGQLPEAAVPAAVRSAVEALGRNGHVCGWVEAAAEEDDVLDDARLSSLRFHDTLGSGRAEPREGTP